MQNKQKYKFAVVYVAGIMAELPKLREVAALYMDNIPKPAMSPDCLLCEVMQPSDIWLSEIILIEATLTIDRA